MKHTFLFLSLLLSGFGLNAQDFCKSSSIFFDLNKSDLKPVGKLLVDSLVTSLNGSGFIFEVYGYTDTSNTNDYNKKLSQSRIDAVLAYLKEKNVVPKEIRTFNEGEDFISNNRRKDAAFQRRVDIYLTPMEGSDVVFRSKDGVIVKRDISSFGDCGICALKPKMKYLQSEAEANENGIDLITDKNERLITYGMVLFDIDPCSSIPEEEQKRIRTCMELPAVRWDSGVELFELIEQPGNDIWKKLQDTMKRDPEQKTVRFCSNARKINCDLIDGPGRAFQLILPIESNSGKSLFLYYDQRKPEKLLNDTVPLKRGVETVLSYFNLENDWYLFKEQSGKIMKEFSNRDPASPNTCLIYVPDYKLAPSKGEIELKMKLKDIDKVGYYHADFDLFVPLERISGNTYSGHMYQNGFELCYIKNDRYYIEKNKAKSLKIKTKNGHSKAKIRRLYLFKKKQLKWKRVKRTELK
ncbi:OmpA family protein [Fluviicola sp.]|uniref:OmpA family protein n=1 Tax=Fluviicola sp. TaxID=1917219 RepID=UPI002630169E|nr:OmpA family protein [Fluviicola sp.]